MPTDSKQHWYLILSLGLVLTTILVYLPVRNHEFVRYDDDVYVTKNQNVQSGLSPQNIKWALTTIEHSYWHPLTWLSLMLDSSLFGVRPGPMHLVNLFFHVTNTILLFLVFSRMTKMLWPGAFVAALFALHPLNVESVAWIAERKNVLSTFFWLLTILAYARYAERPSASRYLITFLFFALGLMSKPMVVTLPFVLLLLDYWPLERIRNPKSNTERSDGPASEIRNLLLEKLPFFLLSAFSGIITCIAQKNVGAMVSLPFRERLANMAVSYLTYIYKLFVPARLAVLYPHPADRIPVIKAAICAVLLILLTVILLYFGRRRKYLAVGWLWFLGTLVPVIGLVQVGAQAMADRYAYIPLIGLFIIIAFGSAELASRIPSAKSTLVSLAAVSLTVCFITTSVQLKYWKDSFSLLYHTLTVTKGNYLILVNFTNVLSDLDRPDLTARYLGEILKNHPGYPLAHYKLGLALKKLDRFSEAVEQYQITLIIDPNFEQARYDLGVACSAAGDFDAAIEQYKLYLGPEADLTAKQSQKPDASKPYSARALSNLGYALAIKGNPVEAIEYYNKALLLDPNDVLARGRLAFTLASVGRLDDAIEQCQIVIAARPDDAAMYNNLGALLQEKGQIDHAAESFKKALQIDPNFQQARDNLNALGLNRPRP